MSEPIRPTRRALFAGLLPALLGLFWFRFAAPTSAAGSAENESEIVGANRLEDRFHATTIYEYDAYGRCVSVRSVD